MRGRLVAAVLVGGLVLAGCGGAGRGGVALRYGDHEVSNDDLVDELNEIAGNSGYTELLQLPPARVDAPDDPDFGQRQPRDSFDHGFIAAVVYYRILFDLARDEVEDRNIELTDADRELLDPSTGQPTLPLEVLDAFSDDYRERLVDGIASLFRLQQEFAEDPEAFGEWQEQAFLDAELEVSSRYGSYDPELSPFEIIAPEGPVSGEPAAEPAAPES